MTREVRRDIKFYGGPYDGVEAEYAAINRCASILPVHGDLGTRVFALMPPRESWDRLLRGEPVETSPLYPYERISTSGQIELVDIAREDTLRLFLERYREAGAAG